MRQDDVRRTLPERDGSFDVRLQAHTALNAASHVRLDDGGYQMPSEGAPGWVTFWDKRNRRVLVIAARNRAWDERDGWSFVAHDATVSKPGRYDVWRDMGSDHTEPPAGSALTGDIVCIELRYEDRVDDIEFPDHLLSRDILSFPTLWSEGFPSFMQWSQSGGEMPMHDPLATEVREFEREMTEFAGFTNWVFTIGELQDDSNWQWGWRQGVYCFISAYDGKVMYVGRALTTVGERIAYHLRSGDDPKWREILSDRRNLVRVFAVEDDSAHMASALEAFLIKRFDPTINSKKQ